MINIADKSSWQEVDGEIVSPNDFEVSDQQVHINEWEMASDPEFDIHRKTSTDKGAVAVEGAIAESGISNLDAYRAAKTDLEAKVTSNPLPNNSKNATVGFINSRQGK